MALHIIVGLIQLVFLIAWTGVLVSLAAVSRLMEVTIILLQPIPIYLLRQSTKLVTRCINVSAALTLRVLRKTLNPEDTCNNSDIGVHEPDTLPACVPETEAVADASEEASSVADTAEETEG